MKVTLTREQMLSQWKIIRAVEPPRLDCTIHRTDGPDIDAILENEMRTRYLDLLDSAPVSLLAPKEMASEAQVTFSSDARQALIVPPVGTRRVLSLAFDHGVPITPEAGVAQALRASKNLMWGRSYAAMLPDGRIMVALPGRLLTELTVIFDHGPETYEFDDSLWKELLKEMTF